MHNVVYSIYSNYESHLKHLIIKKGPIVMAQIIAVANQKGGVAKTFTSRQFSTGLAMKGFRVLAVDGDPQGDLTRQFGITEEDLNAGETLSNLFAAEVENRSNSDSETKYEYDTADAIIETEDNVDVLSATIQLSQIVNNMTNAINKDYIMRDILKQVEDDYDYIIIDCPPDLGPLVINHLFAANKVLIPAFTEEQSLVAITRLITTIKNVRNNDVTDHYIEVDGILFNNVIITTNHAKTYMEFIEDNFPFYVYKTFIPKGVSATEAITNKTSIYEHDKNGKVARACRAFVDEFLNKELSEIIEDAQFNEKESEKLLAEAAELEENGNKREANQKRRKANLLKEDANELYLDAEDLKEIIDGKERVNKDDNNN